MNCVENERNCITISDLQIMAVNIQIGNTVFHCPVGKLAGETVDVIRTSRRLIGGELERNGIVMFAGDKIVADGNYSFIHFEHHGNTLFHSYS